MYMGSLKELTNYSFLLQQGDCIISNVLTLDLTQYEDPHAREDDYQFQNIR